jgi:hypothetical protein
MATIAPPPWNTVLEKMSTPLFQRRAIRLPPAVFLACLLLLPGAAAAQEAAPDTVAAYLDVSPRTTAHSLGTPGEDRARLSTLLDPDAPPFTLIRSASSATPVGTAELRTTLLPVEVRTAYNAGIPRSMNEGALWAGRGWSVATQAGFRLDYGFATLVVAPIVTYAANEPFPHLGSDGPDRSHFVAPWRTGRYSVDLPVRLGTEPVVRIDPGETTLALGSPAATVGISTGAQWWGPGIRNAIVMSNNAPGIPHLFVRTGDPLRTRFGDVEARWMAGNLTESRFFDSDPENDLRSIYGFAATLQPCRTPGLTLGLARTVVTTEGGLGPTLAQAPVGVLRTPPPDTLVERAVGGFQILSLFGRWAFPAEGMEVYGEWARHELPASLSALLVTPNHTQGYTFGLQWARPVPPAPAVLRLQGEVTNLEQSATYRTAPRPAFYTSASVPQGYTHRGRSVGAAIGPGASAQWLAIDLIGSGGGGGLFVNRIRWENDAYYTTPRGWLYHAHDVSLIVGARAHARGRLGTLAVEAAHENRLNFQFQNPSYDFGGAGAVDVSNLSLRLSLSSAR